jgi:hypothetical protein
MKRFAIGIRKNSYGDQAHFPAGTHDPDSNFSTVGYQNLLNHGLIFIYYGSKKRAKLIKNMLCYSGEEELLRFINNQEI